MYWNLSVCLLNPFSQLNNRKFSLPWAYCYNLEYNDNPKHFLREWWLWKKIDNDSQLIDKMFKDSIGGKKTKLNHVLKYLKSNISANLHILVDLSKVPQSFFDFLKAWKLKNQIVLHLVVWDTLTFNQVEKVKDLVESLKYVTIWSLSWESITFDETKNWIEIQKIYDEIVFIQMQTSLSITEYIKKTINEWIKYSEISPVSFLDAIPFKDWDAFIILEPDAEKISSITKAFEVSINENKRKDFNNFNSLFITKPLSHSLLSVLKAPYSIYENNVLLEKISWESILKILSDNEIRVLQLWNQKNLRLINKSFNNEVAVVYDGHKKIRCESLYNEKNELVAQENKILLDRRSEMENLFELSMFAISVNDQNVINKYVQFLKEKELDYLIIDFNIKKVFSNMDLKKNQVWPLDLHKFLLNYFSING